MGIMPPAQRSAHMKKITPTTTATATHADLLAPFSVGDAKTIKDIAKKKKISIAKAIAQHERDATSVVPEVAPPVEAKKKSAKKSKKAVVPTKFSAAKKDTVIKVLVDAPHRAGTFAAAHWQKIERGGVTVEEYLGQYPNPDDRRTASRWLYNFRRAGHVVLEEPTEPQA
jgi:hypothetical protein